MTHSASSVVDHEGGKESTDVLHCEVPTKARIWCGDDSRYPGGWDPECD